MQVGELAARRAERAWFEIGGGVLDDPLTEGAHDAHAARLALENAIVTTQAGRCPTSEPTSINGEIGLVGKG